MENQEPTNKDILEAVDKVAQNITDLRKSTEGSTQDLQKSVNGMQGDIKGLKGDMKGLKGDMKDLQETTEEILEAVGMFANKTETRLDKIEASMVTKGYLDSRLTDLKVDLTILIRKEDNKVVKLAETLRDRKVLSSKDVNPILAMEPSPHKL